MDLPNWISTPHLRRVLQRMQADYTSIFGGRDRELAELDAWLTDEERPYALLLAPTGRGKTALVWHWLARQQHEWQVIFVPVSIRYSNSSQADVFAALTHAFAHMHGEQEDFNALQHSANELRPKLAAYLRRELPDNTRVLLAIDGLDEATGWELGADLLPENPPANLKILLSARDMAQHQRADWYHKLGLPADRTQDFTLGGLDRIALKELLIALGTPLDELAADFDILGELLRVSAGDPVIVRLLVQLLREERIQIGQISQLPADDLNAVFALWLNQLSAQESQIAQILLLLFANAYGPLSARDLLGLAPDHFADADQIAQAIAPLARFVIGDAESGYIFSHQKLRELYRDRLDTQTLTEWNARFVNYSKQAYREPTPYLCRFLVNHLRDAGEWQFIRHLLADFNPQQAWAEARYALEGSYNGYLRDLEMLHNWAIEQDDLALSIHCSLISSSIRSISQNVRGDLLVHLITIGTTKGKWSVEAALGHIEQQTHDKIPNLILLINAGCIIPWERALDLIEHSLEGMLHGYIHLYPIVPEHFQATIIQRVWDKRETWDNETELEDLFMFTHHLDEEWSNRFGDYLFSIEHLWFDIIHIYDQLPEALKERTYQHILYLLSIFLQKLTPDQTNWHAQEGIISFFRFLPSEQQSFAYWGISYQDFLISRFGHTILKLLPAHELQEFLHYLQQINLIETYKTIPGMSYNQKNGDQKLPNSLRNMLAASQYDPHSKETIITKVLEILLLYPTNLNKEILEYLPETAQQQLTKHVLSYVHNNPTETRNLETLIALLPYAAELHAELLETIYTFIPQQAYYYLRIIPYLENKKDQQELIEHTLQISQRIDSSTQQISFLIRLLDYLAPKQQALTSQTIFQAICQIEDYLKQDLLYNLWQKAPALHNAIINYIMETPKLHLLLCNFLPLLPLHKAQTLASSCLEQAIEEPYIEIPIEIFPYLTPIQLLEAYEFIKQNPQSFFSASLLHGLISVSYDPYQNFLAHITQIQAIVSRLRLLIHLLHQMPQNQQIAITQAIQNCFYECEQKGITGNILGKLDPKIINTTVYQFIQQDPQQRIMHAINQNIEFAPAQQQVISQQLWQHLNAQTWSIKQIVEINYLVKHCFAYLDQQQIQAVLTYLNSCDYPDRIIIHLIPYLNAIQLQHIHQIIQNQMPNTIVQFYKVAHEHHQILDQEYYYQSLIKWLSEIQADYGTWSWYILLNEFEAYLKDTDYRNFLQHHLNQIPEPYSHFHIGDTIKSIIDVFQSKKLLNIQTAQHFIQNSAHQERKAALQIIDAVIIAYLETLEPEQAQQLASQINQSIEQITTCWP